jgi:RNA polymerase sigma-70 factor (ECF subfamily)
MTAELRPAGCFSIKTSPSLLLRVLSRDEEAWQRLVYLYSPMVYRWIRKAGLQPNDAEDVVQIVFHTLASDIGRFRKSRPGDSFRGWLWTSCRHKVLDFFRETEHQALAAGGSSAHQQFLQLTASEPDPDDEKRETSRLRHRAVSLLLKKFERCVAEAFLRTVVHGDKPVDVASDLRMSLATVYRAKFRVLTRLRTELQGL